MISYGKQTIDQSDIDTVVQVLKGDWLTQGPAVEAFENELMNYFGSNHACAVANGTAALHLTGLALGWKPGDIVITSPITFLATANCIVYTGATPDFVDIDPVTYTIDPDLVEKKVEYYESKGKNVKAIIGVDYAGQPCDWKSLRMIADKYEVQLVNDNCHALGASYFGNKQYAVQFADVVTQSYHPVKHITTGEGGAILTNDSIIDEKVKRLRTHGMTKSPDKLEKNDGPWYYEMHEIGYNYRITDFQCALGNNQLKKLDKFVERRCEIAQRYDIAFSQDGRFMIPKVMSDNDHAYHLYPLQIKINEINMDKCYVFEQLKKYHIITQVHYIPITEQPFYKKKYGFNNNSFPNAIEFYNREISLPMYPTLEPQTQENVIISLLKIVNGGINQ